ncbi:16S rRNA (guanine(527)-N(7))-methyltransferase RsmG [Helicobacter sp. 13S00477-4]|uniref:16S rRNA (guanine(527)-N(7))-methyltransferase RsmG n=1 Tax=Helicobacter sp. 13S00477-4 TaxID=1905759 RepID=UPI000BA77FBE|nr:16S rRNA (guanine(527)-N(7))-methyltransferase RsmG [Helicobacter sp. 13S00477-4]PAF50830.1 16S rRNA (guanine(527)-N(7))-methyltransferase RsmG [Helicobacter sp. 13S00477-4]
MNLEVLIEEFSLGNACKESFEHYAQILLQWNKVHNLSGVKDLEDIYNDIFDSIYPLRFIEDFGFCIDIGSGAGFPALPLAICKKKTAFILTEPRIKRASFLRSVVIELGLKNISVEKCLIQDLKIPQDFNTDLITSRAVMSSKDLIFWSEKFLNKNGHYLFYKGISLDKEIDFKDNECFLRENRVYFYRKEI